MSEIVYNTVSACKFEETKANASSGEKKNALRTDLAGPWKLVDGAGDDGGGGDALVDCVYSPSRATIRLAPTTADRRGGGRGGKSGKNQRIRWRDDVNFHPDLRVPPPAVADSESSSAADATLALVFEGLAREGIAVALSPKPGYAGGGDTYEIQFGARGNTRTAARRYCPRPRPTTTTTSAADGTGEGEPTPPASSSSAVEASRPSRVCQERAWTSYWVCYCRGKLWAGVGAVPGRSAVVVLDDVARQDTPPPADRQVRYVGFGNAGVADRQAPAPIKLRNIRVSRVPNGLQEQLSTLTVESTEPGEGGAAVVVAMDTDEVDEETKALMEEYQAECRKAKARADKFGVPYKEPEPDAFLPWSQARRLKANPTAGFATGIDMSSPDEKAKQEARKKRFGGAVVQDSTESAADGDAETGRCSGDRPPLPVEQAWDNEKLVRGQRADPPSSLWILPPPPGIHSVAPGTSSSFSMEEQEPPVLQPEKVHIFSIDWAAFKVGMFRSCCAAC